MDSTEKTESIPTAPSRLIRRNGAGRNGAAQPRRVLRGAAGAERASLPPRPPTAPHSVNVAEGRNLAEGRNGAERKVAEVRATLEARPVAGAVVSDEACPPPPSPLAGRLLVTLAGKLMVAALLLALISAIAILLLLNRGKVDPALVKEELKGEIERINGLPEDKVIEKDEQVHVLLENELYTRMGGELHKGLLRTHETLHGQAEAERQARARVRPFLARWESLKGRPERLRREAQKVIDETRSLRGEFGSTAWGSRLAEVEKELETFLASARSAGWEASNRDLQERTDKAAAAGQFAAALRALDDFAASQGGAVDPGLAKSLADQRAALERKGEARAEALIQEARRLSRRGKKAEAASLLDLARPGFEGLSPAQKLEDALRELGK